MIRGKKVERKPKLTIKRVIKDNKALVCVHKRENFAMSQEAVEIKTTIEQWRWSEMQGLELVSPNTDDFKSHPTASRVSKSSAEGGEARDMDGTEPKNQPQPQPQAQPQAHASGSGEKTELVPSSGFGELFRFADGLDYVLMTIGSIGAIVHGSSLPIFLRFFADLVNSFGSNANNIDKMMQEVLKVSFFSR